MGPASRLKGSGYLVSIVSVFLLGVPALKAAAESAGMLACLIAGVVLSITGIGLRWRSHRLEQQGTGAEPRLGRVGERHHEADRHRRSAALR